MPSVIEQLYNGNIHPESKPYVPKSLYAQASERQRRIENKLMEALDEQQKALFEKYNEAEGEVENIALYETFRYALKLGVLLVAEAFVGMDEVTNN